MERNKVKKKKEELDFENYYDGIPEEYYSMTPEELKKSIQEEEEKTKKMKEW